MMTQNDKMERAAILHIPLSEYAFAESEYGLTIRIRAKKRDLTRLRIVLRGSCMQKDTDRFL